jgi:uncharacterized membrane protein
MIRHTQRYLIAGVLTVIPILVTGFVFAFFLNMLSDIGRPKVRILANALRPWAPEVARWLLEVPWLQSALAVVLTLALFYVLGWVVSLMVGRRVLNALESWLERIPLVTKIYSSTKQLINAFKKAPGDARRVVLIEFPHKDMKTVGFVTQLMVDETTGTELAAVYVPTTPNPTSGYLEIVPKEKLVTLDWSVDEAMTFVVSGGTVSPGRMRFTRSDVETPRDAAPRPVRTIAEAAERPTEVRSALMTDD